MQIKKPDTTVFFPLQAYFTQQVKDVNNNADTISKTAIINSKKDFIQINKPTFDSLAKQFASAIDMRYFNNTNYKENVFHDESTNSNTINYSAFNKRFLVQNINILLDPVDQQVKRIFFTKYVQQGDSAITQNFGWKNDENFYINTSIVLKNNMQKEAQLIVTWKKRK